MAQWTVASFWYWLAVVFYSVCQNSMKSSLCGFHVSSPHSSCSRVPLPSACIFPMLLNCSSALFDPQFTEYRVDSAWCATWTLSSLRPFLSPYTRVIQSSRHQSVSSAVRRKCVESVSQQRLAYATHQYKRARAVLGRCCNLTDNVDLQQFSSF
jgi:hypothetical protein